MTVSVIKTDASEDYSTIQAWEDACPADITAGGTNENWEGELFNEEFLNTEGRTVFGGITTDATHKLILRPVSGGGFADNADPTSDALRYQPTLGASIKNTSGYVTVLDFGGSSAVRTAFEGVQIQSTSATSILITNPSHTQPITLDGCILDYGRTGSNIFIFTTSGDDSELNNCVLINTITNRGISGRGATLNFCTFYGTSTGSHVIGSYGVFNFNNCLFLGAPDFQGATQVHLVDFSVTDLASWESSTATNSVLNATASDEIENDSGSASTVDLRAKAGGDSDGGGTSISGITTDIYGQTRDGSTPTVGAFEIISAAGNTITANQTEAGDTNSADFSNVISITSANAEAGDTTAASLIGQLSSVVSANQAEAGDVAVADMGVIIQLFADHTEDGDSQTARFGEEAPQGIALISPLISNLIRPLISNLIG